MKQCINLLAISLIVGCSSPKLTGTATDVNSGSLSGAVQYSSRSYKEKIDMTLYNSDGEIVQEKRITDGTYRFDSLGNGTYSVSASVRERAVLLGQENSIELVSSAVHDIIVKRIIQKSFEFTANSGTSLEVNSFELTNMKIDTVKKYSYLLTFAEGDQDGEIGLNFSCDNIEKSGRIKIIQQDSVTYKAKLIETSELGLINRETKLLSGTGNDTSLIVIDGIID